ncbi:efflux RND transporter periplasmic adaptor subunit [bacterium]|nr:efflux RND transporter periplasmic adaptor subunit [bacterium]
MQTRSKSFSFVLINALVVWVLVCCFDRAQGRPDDIDRVRRERFIQTRTLTGTLVAERAEEFYVPRTRSWQIQIKWMVAEGTVVKPDDVVVRFDNSALSGQIEELEKTLEDKRKQLLEKKAEQVRQKVDLGLSIKQAEVALAKEEIDAALPAHLVSDYEYQKSRIALKRCQSELEQAQQKATKEHKSMELDLERLVLEIERTEINLTRQRGESEAMSLSAHTSGAVLYALHSWHDRKIQIGDTVGASMVVATVPDPTSLHVEAWINEAGVLSLAKGQPVKIWLDAFPDREFQGVVYQISNSAEKKPRWGETRYFSVIIKLDQVDQEIMRPGMSVRCQVKVKELDDVLVVPLARVTCRGNVYCITPHAGAETEIEPLGINAFAVAFQDRTGSLEGVELD